MNKPKVICFETVCFMSCQFVGELGLQFYKHHVDRQFKENILTWVPPYKIPSDLSIVAALLYLLWDKISVLKVQISVKWASFIQIKVLCFIGLWKLVKESAFTFFDIDFLVKIWTFLNFWRSLPIDNTFWTSIIPIIGTE